MNERQQTGCYKLEQGEAVATSGGPRLKGRPTALVGRLVENGGRQ